MNKSNYRKIKWTSLSITLLILLSGLFTLYLLGKQPSLEPTPQPAQPDWIESSAGHYTNEDFSHLLENSLSSFNFLKNIQFKGLVDGHFILSGTLSEPKHLIALCPELASFESLLTSLKDEPISIHGHLGETAEGNGRFIADTITFSGYTFPAGTITPYIEQYTAINDLLEVPLEEITVDSKGITFQKELPASINQTA